MRVHRNFNWEWRKVSCFRSSCCDARRTIIVCWEVKDWLCTNRWQSWSLKETWEGLIVLIWQQHQNGNFIDHCSISRTYFDCCLMRRIRRTSLDSFHHVASWRSSPSHRLKKLSKYLLPTRKGNSRWRNLLSFARKVSRNYWSYRWTKSGPEFEKCSFKELR